MLETKPLNVALSKELSIKLLLYLFYLYCLFMCYTGIYKKEIESKYFKFIWDGKPEKVKKKNT